MGKIYLNLSYFFCKMGLKNCNDKNNQIMYRIFFKIFDFGVSYYIRKVK